MKKGETYEGVIDSVAFPNKGRVAVEDATVTVKNGIPGQKVRFRIDKKRGGRLSGRITDVLERSPIETVAAQCPHFGACGGCVYQTVEHAAEMEMKAHQVRELFEEQLVPYGKSWGALFDGISSGPDARRYRNKMEYAFGDSEKGGPLTLGLHKRNSNFDILPATECLLVHEDFNRIVACAQAFFRERGLPHFHRITHEGYLRHLLVRRAAATGEILVALVTTGRSDLLLASSWAQFDGPGIMPADIARAEKAQCAISALERMREDFVEALEALDLEGRIVGIIHVENDAVSDIIRPDLVINLAGRDHFYEELLDLRFRITPFSFFQTNSRGAEVLYSRVREYIGDVRGKTVFDLYSGTGTIAQVLAPVAERVIGVEIVEEAVGAARENAAKNGLANCEFIAGDVLAVVDGLEKKPDVIVLDPPRDGVHPKALPKIIDFGAERIVYVSCKPTSLVRDLEQLLAVGYRVERMSAVDLFPMTPNVEVIASLRKKDCTVRTHTL